MITKTQVKKLFDLTKIEEKEELLRQKVLRDEELKVTQKTNMIEYMVEHLDPRTLIAVHQTDYLPENGILRPTGHFLFNLFKSNNAKKIIEDLQLKHPRVTIHFTLNYPATGVVAGGEWITWKCKYAILIPVIDFIDRIKCLNPVDTWIIGALELPPSAEILMEEHGYFKNQEILDQLTGNAKIIPFPDGINIHKAIEDRIRKKGYRLMGGGDFDWYQEQTLQNIVHFINESKFISEKEKTRLKQICTTRGYIVWTHVFDELGKKLKKLKSHHFKTEWRRFEVWLAELYSMFFNPSDYELGQHVNFFDLKVWSASGNAKIHKEEIIKLIDSGEYNFPHEKVYLEQLKDILDRLEKWLAEIEIKYRAILNKDEMTWGEFLRGEKII